MKDHQITLTNNTTYLSRDLKKFFSYVLKQYKKTHFDFNRQTLFIRCENTIGKKVIVLTDRNSLRASKSSTITFKLPKIKLFNQSEKLRQMNNVLGVLDESSAENFEAELCKNYIWALDMNAARTRFQNSTNRLSITRKK